MAAPEPELAWCPIATPACAPFETDRERQARDLLARLQDEFLGSAPERCKPGAFATFCELAVLSEDLDDLFLRGIRFFSLISDHIEVQYHITRTTREFVVRPVHATTPNAGLFLETWLCAWYRLASWVVGRRIPLASVSFCHESPADGHRLIESFGIPCTFNAACTGFRFSSDHASLRPVRGVLELRELTASGRASLFDIPPPESTYTDLVVQATRRLSDDWPRDIPSFSRVADHLCITPQTLRRKLSDEGTHFKQVRDGLRRDYVREALQYSSHSLETIAVMAGFSETSSLIRAFKRWTGKTPAAFRRAP